MLRAGLSNVSEYKFRCLFLSGRIFALPDFGRKYWLWLLPLLCAVYCAVEAIGGGGDFYIFLSAADDLGKENIFEKKYVDGYHYFYSVFFALLLKPFVSLPYYWLKFSWLLLNALLFFDLLRMLYKSNLVSELKPKQRSWFIILIFICALRFFTDNIHTSQITILILWCSIKGLELIFSGHPLKGAAVLALGINIKLLPLVFIPYLIYRAQFKAAFFTVLIYISLLFFPSLIIGHQYNMSLLHTWLSLINPSQQIHVLDVDERSFHGLSTLFSTLLVKNVPDVYALNIPRNIADVSLQTLATVILIVRLILASFTLYFLRLKFFSKAQSLLQQCFETSYILLIIPLIFPHQQHYAFLFAIPSLSLLIYFLMRDTESHPMLIALTILIAITFNLKMILGEFIKYYDHFKIITWAALLLIPTLAYAFKKSRKKITSRRKAALPCLRALRASG
jgi:hypothetical protein